MVYQDQVTVTMEKVDGDWLVDEIMASADHRRLQARGRQLDARDRPSA